MNTPSLDMARQPARVRARPRGLAVLALSAGAWALSGTAHARDNIHWSIGINSPGVSVGVSNAPTVVYSYPSYGYPVYYEPRPVVVYPRPVVVHPRPVVVHSYPVYGHPQWHGHRGHKHWKKHHRGHRHWDD
jgi:hypothetical protein